MPEDAETELIEDVPVEVVEVDRLCGILHVVSYDNVEKMVMGEFWAKKVLVKKVTFTLELDSESAAKLVLMEDENGDVVATISPNMTDGMRNQTL